MRKLRQIRTRAAAAVCSFGVLVFSACKTNEQAMRSPTASRAVETNAPLKQIAPGLFQLGLVKLDKNSRSVRFPAVVNQARGMVEYLLVTSEGKTHESLLRTDVRPHQIHLGMLLIGAQGTTNAFPADSSQPLPGDEVAIEVTWTRAGKHISRRAEELIFNTKTRSQMREGDWVYNGSLIIDGVFVAEEQGSIISIIEDTYALINNSRPGRENDEIWEASSKHVPPSETPVEVTIRLVSGDVGRH